MSQLKKINHTALDSFGSGTAVDWLKSTLRLRKILKKCYSGSISTSTSAE